MEEICWYDEYENEEDAYFFGEDMASTLMDGDFVVYPLPEGGYAVEVTGKEN